MPAFAGLIDRRGRADAEADRAARAVSHDGPVRTCAIASLALAWSGDGEPAGEPLCFLDGHVYNLDSLGDPPDARPPTTPEARLSALFRDRGESLLAELRGDFVLVIYDRHRDAGVFGRDQLGGRAVFWHEAGGRLTFASEVRYLLPLLSARPEPDPATLAHWLALSGQPGDHTLYAGVRRLQPAHVLRFGDGPPITRRYWSPHYRPVRKGSRPDQVAGLRAALVEAVQRRCPPTQTTGVLLSGGLDSSTVAALSTDLDRDHRPTRAYSATFPDHPSVDEGPLVDVLCRALGLAGTRLVVRSGSVAAGAIAYIAHWELPPPSPNLFFWLPLLRQAAADGVAVLIDGEGGDELFGLSPYLLADRLRHARPAAALELVRRMPGGGSHLSLSSMWPFVYEFGVKGATPAWLHRATRRWRGARRYTPPWLGPSLRQVFLEADVTAEWKRIPGPRWWAYLVAATTRGMGADVTYDHVRRRAALAGVEARHPLIDVDVIEYVLTLPPELAYDPRHSRPLVREAMEGLLPDEVRLRASKSTFDAVFHDALAGPDLRVARALLRPEDAELGAYVDLDLVAGRLLTAAPPPAARLGWGLELWRLITAECWLRAQAGRGPDAEGWPALTSPVLEVVRGPGPGQGLPPAGKTV